jgi:two-component system, OmpR family, phosphate regulon response regulator PhoB
VIRVLHIDDQAPVRLLSRVNLAAEGMEVIEAADALTGLRLATREQPDLILLNALLRPGAAPGFRWPRDPAQEAVGWQVAWELKKNPATWQIPIVFLTAMVRLKDRVRGFDLGAVDYIAQPFNPTELAARLRGLLERLERGERAELRRENIILNVLASPAVRRDVRKLEAFRRMCESAITAYEGTEDECVADWAREALRLLDKRSWTDVLARSAPS